MSSWTAILEVIFVILTDQKMTPTDPRNFHTSTHFHTHDNNTTLVFLPTDGEPSWLLLTRLVTLLSGSTVQP